MSSITNAYTPTATQNIPNNSTFCSHKKTQASQKMAGNMRKHSRQDFTAKEKVSIWCDADDGIESLCEMIRMHLNPFSVLERYI